MMTPKELDERIAALMAEYDKNNNEFTHEAEDELLYEVLNAIANAPDGVDVRPLASMAASINLSERTRWYA